MSSIYIKLVSLLVIIFSTAASYLLLIKLREPYVWIVLLWIAALIVLISVIKSQLIKKISLSMIIILFMLGAVEFYFNLKFPNDPTIARGDILEDYSGYHDKLGYKANKDTVIPVAKYHGDELVYKATYSIDGNGFRVGTDLDPEHIDRCMVFFGGSFTFGRGVEDYETLPYLISKKTDGRFRTFNMAFNGYGPHQMLAIIENNLEQEVIDCDPDIGIYHGIVHHVARVNGHVNWDIHGPRYVIDENGTVRQEGHFDDFAKTPQSGLIFELKRRLHLYLSKSRFYTEAYVNVKAARNLDNFVELYLGVVDKSRDLFLSRYPNSEFFVIFWDDPVYFNKYTKKILEGFDERGINVFLISDMLPGYLEDTSQYELSPYDSHPNPKAYDLISEYVLQNIFQYQVRLD